MRKGPIAAGISIPLSMPMMFMFGCSSPEQDFESVQPMAQVEVLNGIKAEGHYQFPSIISLASKGGKEQFCTGTLWKADTVITAAHCLAYGLEDLVAVYRTMDLEKEDGLIVEIESGMEHPDYFYGSENDLAVILLKEKIERANTAAFLPVELYGEFLQPEGIVVIAGYGLNSEGTSGILYFGEVPIIERSEIEMIVGNKESANLCYGDSGGPTYKIIDDKLYLTGVTSRLPPQSYQCGEGAIVTLTAPYEKSLEEMLQCLRDNPPEEEQEDAPRPSEEEKDEEEEDEPEIFVPENPAPTLEPSGGCNSKCTVSNYCRADDNYLNGFLFALGSFLYIVRRNIKKS